MTLSVAVTDARIGKMNKVDGNGDETGDGDGDYIGDGEW